MTKKQQFISDKITIYTALNMNPESAAREANKDWRRYYEANKDSITRNGFEFPNNEEAQDKRAKELGILITNYATNREFHSQDISVDGVKYGADDLSKQQVKTMRENGTKIIGLRCPDCNAQAFRTDHSEVAVCGNYPGWYFFYRKREQKIKLTTRLILKDGEMVEVKELE